MRSLLAAGIRRCPECGKHVPRGLFLYVEPRDPVFYLTFGLLALAPTYAAIAARLFLAVSARPVRFIPESQSLLAVTISYLYCYVLTLIFCRAHKLPRAGFGAFAVAFPVLLVNLIFAGGLLLRD
jgi:hypothetical protein